MKLLEFHILQSFPVTCLNRDDANIPKTAQFGGVTRARISSQCLKRAVRKHAALLNNEAFGKSSRTKYIPALIIEALGDSGTPEHRRELAAGAAEAFGKFDASDKEPKIKTLFYLSPSETKAVAQALEPLLADSDKITSLVEEQKKLTALENDDQATKKAKETAAKEIKKLEKAIREPAKKVAEKSLKELRKTNQGFHDAVDIALFGRMVADSPDIGVDGSCYFAHALSTHEAEPQQDFYSALDDTLRERKERGDEDAHAGSGMLGVLEFTTATYYRYAAVNLDQLLHPDSGYLKGMTPEEQRRTLETLIEAVIQAIPNARGTGMNGDNPPAYVIGSFKKSAQPVQLVNAFEGKLPRHEQGGHIASSVSAMLKHRQAMIDYYGLPTDHDHATGYHRPEEENAPSHRTQTEFISELCNALFNS